MASGKDQQLICASGSSYPHDVMVHEILPQLPAKTLIRCKCLSKLYLKMISEPNPEFVKSHLMFQKPGRINICQGSILHFTGSTEVESYKLNLLDILNEPSLLAIKSCNGLLFLRNQVKKLHYIINPITRQFMKIPSVHNHLSTMPVQFTDCFMHFDKVSSQYRVLGWNANLLGNPFPVFVLILDDRSVETKMSWKAFNTGLPKERNGATMMWYQPVWYNRWYHWIVSHNAQDEWSILALNLESREFRMMKVPDTQSIIPSEGWKYRLVLAKDSFYLIQYHCPGGNYCYIIWRLEDYEQQTWTEVCQYRVEYCQRCKESGWDSASSSSAALPFDVKEIIKRGPQYYKDVAHTNSFVWLDTKLD